MSRGELVTLGLTDELYRAEGREPHREARVAPEREDKADVQRRRRRVFDVAIEAAYGALEEGTRPS